MNCVFKPGSPYERAPDAWHQSEEQRAQKRERQGYRVRLGHVRKVVLEKFRCDTNLSDRDRSWIIEALLHAQRAVDAPRTLKKTSSWSAEHLPWATPKEILLEWDGMKRSAPMRASDYGQALQLTDQERERLKVWRIYPIDMTYEELQARSKARKRERDRGRKRRARAAAGAKKRPTSLAKSKPWEAMGVSRATYYRRLRETQRSAANIPNIGADIPVSSL